MTKSCGVTLARLSIASTSSGGVGTQTTSLPAWPTCGTNGSSWAGACAPVLAAVSTARQNATSTRRFKHDAIIESSQAYLRNMGNRNMGNKRLIQR
jgi:hypothetical protein